MSAQHTAARMPLDAWKGLARERFGDDPLRWRFVCPSCGHAAAVDDWRQAGAPEGAVAFSCVGRYTGDPAAAASAAFRNAGGPCNYTSGGLFCINRLFVTHDDGKESPAFEVAELSTAAAIAQTEPA
jgi:hypothetical protein